MSPGRKTSQRRDLTVEKLVEATLEILKSSDPSALTMRRVAKQCGVSAMAIYHHVSDKDQLATMAVDSLFLAAAQGELPGSNWREQCVHLWSTIRASMLAVPGAGMIFVRQAIIGPGTALATERMFALLSEGGLNGEQVARTNDALTMLLIGSIANELTRPKAIREELGKQVPDGQTPLLHQNMKTYAHRDGTQRYLQAVDWILDGVLHS